MSGLISATELTRARIDELLGAARGVLKGEIEQRWRDAIVGLMFYEDSLRTRVGFEAAAARLGARPVGVYGAKHTAIMSGAESVDDAARSIAEWCSVLCLRHPEADAPRRVAAAVRTPVINCGNGDSEHPTQALIDVLTMDELLDGVEDLHVAIVGDLHGMRAAHSLAIVLGQYQGVRLRCIAPRGLEMPTTYLEAFQAGGNPLEETDAMEVEDVDVLYAAGLPETTRLGPVSKEERRHFFIDRGTVDRLPDHARILCPLPRIDEIAREVDATPQAAYFEQSRLSVAMRTAILDEVLRAHRG
jgi:aspartate carbamoyltransferase catalytic subunit